ncbi:MAG: glycosyltransferase family 4 protein [Methanobacteriota archaeon]|nr:MAG: glycosyltransferase family 4 protein [Euryarchaeota archaeon]
MKELCDVQVLTWGKETYPEGSDVPTTWVWTPSTDVFLERRLMLSLSAMFRSDDYDLVHSLYSVPSVFPSLKTKTLATVHIVPEISPDNIWLRYKGLWQRYLFPRCSGVIAVSENLGQMVQERYRPKNLRFIPHGIDTTYFSPKNASGDYFENMRDGHDLVSLSIGLHGGDVQETLRLASIFQNVLFVIVGGTLQQEFIGRNIRTLPRLSEIDMLRAYNSCDLFFRPLKFATANNSLLEAMSMGKPIVTNKIPGVIDYLDNDTAFLVENMEYEKAFRIAVEDTNERRKRASGAFNRARQEYDWRLIAKRTKEVYDEILATA